QREHLLALVEPCEHKEFRVKRGFNPLADSSSSVPPEANPEYIHPSPGAPPPRMGRHKETELDTEPPQPRLLYVGLTLLPAFFAASYAIVSATASSLSPARRAALRDSLTGANRKAMDRLILHQARLETRWLIGRVAGVSATAALMAWLLTPVYEWSWIVAWVSAIAAYAVPTEVARQFTRPRADRFLPGLLRLVRVGEWLVAPFADPL